MAAGSTVGPSWGRDSWHVSLLRQLLERRWEHLLLCDSNVFVDILSVPVAHAVLDGSRSAWSWHTWEPRQPQYITLVMVACDMATEFALCVCPGLSVVVSAYAPGCRARGSAQTPPPPMGNIQHWHISRRVVHGVMCTYYTAITHRATDYLVALSARWSLRSLAYCWCWLVCNDVVIQVQTTNIGMAWSIPFLLELLCVLLMWACAMVAVAHKKRTRAQGEPH